MRTQSSGDWRREIRRRLEPLKLSPTREAEIVEEVAQHLDDRYRELRASGRSDEDAAASAWRELDETDVLGREVGRVEVPAPLDLPPPGAPARGRWLRHFMQDVRYALRTLCRSPGASATVLLAVALAIGPTTAILSIGNWLLWRPHPGASDPDRLAVVWVGRWRGPTSMSPSALTAENLAAVMTEASTVSAAAGVQEQSVSVSLPGVLPRERGGAHVSWNFFDVLGVRMRAGRGFLREDSDASTAPVAVISHGLARALFVEPEAALSKPIHLNGRPFTIAGVASPEFTGITPTGTIDVWMPDAALGYLVYNPEPRAVQFYSFVMRLAPGADFDRLQNELDALLPALANDSLEANDKFASVRARVFPRLGFYPLGRPSMSRTVRTMTMVGIVLMLLGCANVANLLILRTARRAHEIAVRKSLGASAPRLVQVQLVESCALALGGATLGLGLALVLKELIQHLLFPNRPGYPIDVPLDSRVLGMTMAAAMATGLIAAAAPAWMAVRAGTVAAVVRAGSRTATRAPRLRGALGAVQLALSLALLIGALLLVTTLRNLRGIDLGLDPQGVTAFGVNLESHGYTPDRSLPYYRATLSALESRGEFEAVALAEGAPFGPGEGVRIHPPRVPGGQVLRALSNTVTADYFRLLRIPILLGRGFSNAESLSGAPAPVVIVSETTARSLYGTLDVVGETLRLQHLRHPLTIIGVARDAHWRNVTAETGLFVYLPLSDETMPHMQVLVRSALPSADVAEIAQSIAAGIDARIPLSYVRPLTIGIDSELSDQRLFAWVFSLLAAFAFVLASLGLFALVAQSAAERAREFGIRLALGAQRRDIVRLVSRYAMVVTAGGVTAGLAFAWFGTRAVNHLLFGITRLEPAVYIVAVLTLASVVALACIAPIRRATRVQPVDVLRSE